MGYYIVGKFGITDLNYSIQRIKRNPEVCILPGSLELAVPELSSHHQRKQASKEDTTQVRARSLET